MNQQMEKPVKGPLDENLVPYLANPAPVFVVNVGHPDPEATVPLVSGAGPLVLPGEGRDGRVVPLPLVWKNSKHFY